MVDLIGMVSPEFARMTSALFATALVTLKGDIRVSLSELLLDAARLNNSEEGVTFEFF